jgi:hypothetical protein
VSRPRRGTVARASAANAASRSRWFSRPRARAPTKGPAPAALDMHRSIGAGSRAPGAARRSWHRSESPGALRPPRPSGAPSPAGMAARRARIRWALGPAPRGRAGHHGLKGAREMTVLHSPPSTRGACGPRAGGAPCDAKSRRPWTRGNAANFAAAASSVAAEGAPPPRAGDPRRRRRAKSVEYARALKASPPGPSSRGAGPGTRGSARDAQPRPPQVGRRPRRWRPRAQRREAATLPVGDPGRQPGPRPRLAPPTRTPTSLPTATSTPTSTATATSTASPLTGGAAGGLAATCRRAPGRIGLRQRTPRPTLRSRSTSRSRSAVGRRPVPDHCPIKFGSMKARPPRP